MKNVLGDIPKAKLRSTETYQYVKKKRGGKKIDELQKLL